MSQLGQSEGKWRSFNFHDSQTLNLLSFLKYSPVLYTRFRIQLDLTLYMYIVHCTLYMLHSLYTVLLNATCIIRGLHMVETVWPNAGLGSTCIIIVGFGVLLSYDPCTQAGHLGVNQVELA